MKCRGVNLLVKHPSRFSCACMSSYLMHMHAIGASKGRVLLEIERVRLEDQETNPELEVQPAKLGEPEEVVECRVMSPPRL